MACSGNLEMSPLGKVEMSPFAPIEANLKKLFHGWEIKDVKGVYYYERKRVREIIGNS